MLTLLALIVSVCSFLISAGALWFSRKQTQLAREAVALSERSAVASEQSAAASKQAVRLGQRAYLTVGSIEITRRVDLDVPVEAQMVLTNTGTTPALGLTVEVWLRAFENKPATLPFHEGKTFKQADLGSGENHNLTVIGSENYEFKAKLIVEGRSTLYLYGRVRYEDASRSVHDFSWCYRYLPQTKTFHFEAP